MLAFARVGLAAAFTVLSSLTTFAADKSFQRDDLADGAIRLEAQIKKDAGDVAKPVATLRRDADAAFQRNDFSGGMQILSQIAASAGDDASNWLRLSRAIFQIYRVANDRERQQLLEKAALAAYIAYQRSSVRNEEADALVLIGRSYAQRNIWRPALDATRISLDMRESAEVRGAYEKMREEHGFRLLDYSVDADAASPRACFQFSESLAGRRTDFSPFVSVAGQDKPALSADERQLCVEGLKHGERYAMTLRAGLPSQVKESLTKSADFTIYVRDRKAFVRFTGKAYVLPSTGQRGIPLVSVNTSAVNIEIYRVGDRNLLDTVLGSDFQRSVDRYDLNRLANSKGAQVWKGELKTENQLNADITTAFPVDQAVGKLEPGVYVMAAEAAGASGDRDYELLATQWFIVSDLGLTSFSGPDGVHVFVNSLATTAPKGDLEIRLLARNNEVLATRKTDAQGHVLFEAGLARGEGGLAPALVVASDPKGDYGFLNLKSAAFDLSDRGVGGRAAPDGLDAFVYSERGVYRTGETVHLTAILRDGQGVASLNAPLTMVVERPDGVEYRRVTVADQGIGGRNLDVPIASTATTGTWRVRAYTDPKRPPVGDTSFMVEDYVPDRIEFDLTSAASAITKGTPIDVAVNGRYLYGAPASELGLDGEITVKPAKQRPGFPGYQFGSADDESDSEETAAAQQPLEEVPDTDEAGKATFPVTLDKVPDTNRPLEAQITVRMAESGGRAVERTLTLPVAPSGAMVGIKPLFSGRALSQGDTAQFDIVVASPDGKPLARNALRYELVRIERQYQWYRRDGSWNYEPIKRTERVADGTLDVAADHPGRIAMPVQWGRYRLEVSTGASDGPVSAVYFTAGWYSDASADTPDMLELALDKPDYKPGDTMTVAVTARTSGKVLVNIVGDRLIRTVSQDVQPGISRVQLPVGRDWGNGGYVVATLLRPLDAQAQRMSGRSIGVQWFNVDRAAKSLAVNLTTPQLIRPNTTLRIPVKIDGLAGEQARLVVAAVDVGILNLTNYKPPAPDDYYLGQRRLSAEIRDIYGQLLDGMQGTRGQIRTGGDSAGASIQGSPPTQPPLALYSGLVTVGQDGTAEVSFDIPDFAGTARVMAVAWSKDKVGKAVGDVIVRDPVVLTATLPRFLLTGDRGTLHLELDNVEGEPGDYRVSVEGDGPVSIASASQSLTLRAKQRGQLTMPLSVSAVGSGTVKVRIAGPGNFAAERSYNLPVKPATQVLTRRTVRPIARGGGITLSDDLFADLVLGTGALSLSVGPSTALDAATLLKSLDRYPFGCSEQITSRAMPLLYVNDLAAEQHLALDTAIDPRIRDAIERLLTRQGANGSFGLWSVGGDDVWLDSYVTDFLTRAREKGFAVHEVGFKLALDRLRNVVANAGEPGKDGGVDLAYALYVLARNGAAPVGDLRYIADTKLADIKTPIAKAQIAAALGLMGDKGRADRVYADAVASITPPPRNEYGRADYGSTLRDAAAVVTLAAEGGAAQPVLMNAVQRVETARNASFYTSTQENAWMVLAARALGKETRMALTVNGEAKTNPVYQTFRSGDLQSQPVRIVNTGDRDLQAVVSVSGAPITPEPASDKGFKIERNYYTLDGEAVDPSQVAQNTRLAVVLKITEPDPHYGRVLVADYLPAGFEIDNPNLVSSGDTSALNWIENGVEPVHSEFRDDHFGAAFDRAANSSPIFTVAYVVRAVSPGQYVLPQAYVEDMYRPDRYGRTATGKVEVVSAK